MQLFSFSLSFDCLCQEKGKIVLANLSKKFEEVADAFTFLKHFLLFLWGESLLCVLLLMGIGMFYLTWIFLRFYHSCSVLEENVLIIECILESWESSLWFVADVFSLGCFRTCFWSICFIFYVRYLASFFFLFLFNVVNLSWKQKM